MSVGAPSFSMFTSMMTLSFDGVSLPKHNVNINVLIKCLISFHLKCFLNLFSPLKKHNSLIKWKWPL